MCRGKCSKSVAGGMTGSTISSTEGSMTFPIRSGPTAIGSSAIPMCRFTGGCMPTYRRKRSRPVSGPWGAGGMCTPPSGGPSHRTRLHASSSFRTSSLSATPVGRCYRRRSGTRFPLSWPCMSHTSRWESCLEIFSELVYPLQRGLCLDLLFKGREQYCRHPDPGLHPN